jgi:predicted ATPase/signal transduction histidine kinase
VGDGSTVEGTLLDESGDAAGCTITETVHTSSRGVVYRGALAVDGRSVIIKVLPVQYSRVHLERLQNEHEIGKLLHVPTVIRPLARVTYQGRPGLVLEDFGGEPLSRQLGAPLEVERFLRLALAIAAGVVDVHQQDIVHKDLKPDNILVQPTTGQVKIADFGIATTLLGQRQTIGSARLLEGSLPYMSPEQTGRTNRALDHRSDLYSLGVTFFEMLTGTLPFHASDPLEWLHCHIARRPPPPVELIPSLPPILSALVLKLLAKEPEDRYQTARGLRRDLARCLDAWVANGHLEAFPLGEGDVADRFTLQQRLYGRDREIAELLGAFEWVVDTGAPELLLVSGYSGIGKSALVGELQRPIVRERGLFAQGKFDQHKRDIPYSTIVQAFRQLVLEILAESVDRISSWRNALRAALGVNGQLIVDVIPQIELVIGPQAPLPALPPAESQNRFRLVFRNFIAVFAQKQHPLALFLDDLQWADSASLELLEDLLTQRDSCYLLLVGAYRDNEVDPAHPLTLAVDRVRRSGAQLSQIVLGPLSWEDLGAFISDLLHCPLARAAPLVDLVEEKTGRNPFFAIQFLTALHDERLIEFDPASAQWRWDIEKIRSKGFTDNVVELMVAKLKRLPAETEEALRLLACLGTGADVATIAMVLGWARQESAHAALSQAVRAGLLVRSGDSYRFLHDRIQEAAYSLVPQESRAAVHLLIGRQFVAELPEETLHARVFEVVNQLNLGKGLIHGAAEKETLRRLNILAGTKAKAAIAYASARGYLAQAAALSPADAWSAHYQETLSLTLARAECAYLLGDFEEAEDLFGLLLENAGSKTDRARICTLRIRLYQITGRYDEGLELALDTFALFGLACPTTDAEIHAAFAAEAGEIKVNLRGRQIADLVDAPAVTDPEVRAVIGLLIDYLPCAYNGGSKTFPVITLKVLNVCLRHGNVEESCFAYSAAALILVSFFGDIASAYAFSDMSLRLNEKFNDAKLRGTLLFVHGAFANFYRRPFASSAPIFERALVACMEVGDFVYAGYNASHAVWHAIEKGDPLPQVLAVSRRYAVIYKQIHSEINNVLLRLYDQFVASLQGKTRAPASFDDDHFSEADCLVAFRKAGATSGCFIHHLFKEIAAFIHGQNAEAMEWAVQARALLAANMGSALELTHHFYEALILAANHPEAPADPQPEVVQALEEKLVKLKRWAESCPENYLNRYHLVSAELARIQGRDLEAMRLYEQAIRSAASNGLCQNQALANELCARFYRTRGFPGIAEHHLGEARACYRRWGADGKVRQLDQLYPQLRERGPLASSTSLSTGSEQIDLLSVTKASQAISGEIVLDSLLAKLVQVVMAQAGASKGYVILRRDDALTIEAEAQVDARGALAVEVLRSLPVASSPLLPASVVNYAWRTKEKVLLENATQAPTFASDDYILRARPKSILCLPILRQAELVGLLYLENNLVTGAFRSDELSVLELLAGQAAISLDHALLLSKEQGARLQAIEALRMREEFLTVVSHELRTPLTSLTWTLQTLRGEASPAPIAPVNTAQLVDLAVRQVKRMNRLVGELLDVSRIRAGGLSLELSRVDLAKLVGEVIQRLKFELDRARCTVSVAGDPVVMGLWDPERLDQLIENLLSNALKFGAGQPIEVRVSERSGSARLTIRDLGIGIDPDQQARLFERFGRAVSQEHYGGIGLGLFICRRIVEAHGGSISVVSHPGAGAAFTVELPCAGPPSGAPAGAATTAH